MHKFFGSRRLRASPQGYSPWTSLQEGHDALSHDPLRWRGRHVAQTVSFRRFKRSEADAVGNGVWDYRKRGPGRVALGRRPQATTAKKLVHCPQAVTTATTPVQ